MQVVGWGNKEERTTVMSKLVMIIDDSLTVRKILETTLKREGFLSESYPDGIEALRALSQRGHPVPDLVILDIGLPKMDGYEVARHLKTKQQFGNTTIVMLSKRDGVTKSSGTTHASARAWLPGFLFPNKTTRINTWNAN